MSYEIINGCFRRYADGRECTLDNTAGRAEYQRRTDDMAERQSNFCAICMEWMILATFDHALGRGGGGGHRDDKILIGSEWNNAALCHRCQGVKGSQRYHWINDFYYVPIIYATLAEAVAGGHKTDRCDGGDAPWLGN